MTLIERLEAATGQDYALDLALAEWAYERRVPFGFYGNGSPINYDPALWIERHGWSPTGSIDAALTLVDAETDPLDILEDALATAREDRDGVYFLPLHICIAALCAREAG